MKKFEAVIFDLDGVITDTAEYHYLAWKQLGEALGIPFDREFNETLKGVSRTDSLDRILELGQRQNDFSLAEKEALATKKNDHYVGLIQNVSPADILPGIAQLLIDLRAKGYKIAMASASKNAFAVTDSLGLFDYFDHIVDAAKVVHSKPDPEVFLKAAEAIGVAPETCIGVEDAAAGVTAINDAGMYAIAIGTDAGLSHADMVLSATDELTIEVIENI
ncbi:MAG: beta-phosphoglucomutase [Turicibacter sp.]|nr:beta-phosphoglucomutase [Turicibacter sp.]